MPSCAVVSSVLLPFAFCCGLVCSCLFMSNLIWAVCKPRSCNLICGVQSKRSIDPSRSQLGFISKSIQRTCSYGNVSEDEHADAVGRNQCLGSMGHVWWWWSQGVCKPQQVHLRVSASGLVTRFASGSCLPDAIPPSQRQNLVAAWGWLW